MRFSERSVSEEKPIRLDRSLPLWDTVSSQRGWVSVCQPLGSCDSLNKLHFISTEQDADFCSESRAYKAKGRAPFRNLALFPISKIWFGLQITTNCQSELFGACKPLSPHFLYFSAVTFVARAFSVPSVSFQLPECFASSVAGSLDGPRLLSPSGRSLFR